MPMACQMIFINYYHTWRLLSLKPDAFPSRLLRIFRIAGLFFPLSLVSFRVTPSPIRRHYGPDPFQRCRDQ